jgi:hypothetical protein
MARNSTFGQKLIESLQDAIAYERGELAASTRTYARLGGEWVLMRDENTTAPSHHEACMEVTASVEKRRSPQTPTKQAGAH